MRIKTKSFLDLESQWYQILEQDGFRDIEDLSNANRPLKEWHSFKFTSKARIIIHEQRSQYQAQVDAFLNHPSFDEACIYISKHGRCKFTPTDIRFIWEKHTQGATTREIASEVNRWKSRVDDVLKRLREWMSLVA